MKLKTRHRTLIVCGAVGLVFTLFSFRLVHLQVVKHDEYAAIAAKKNSIRKEIPARRGLITDRNGEILAANLPIRRVVLDGTHVRDPYKLASVAAPFLDGNTDELAKVFDTDDPYRVVQRRIPERTALQLQQELSRHSLRGLYFEETTERVYPNENSLSHVLGYLSRKKPEDVSLTGVEGIERSMDSYLHGKNGFRHIEKDRTGREIVVYRGQEQGPQHGHNVRLTIDMGLQAIVEEELANACAEMSPESATAIMMDPHTGEILAMATSPDYNPNELSVENRAAQRNRAIMDVTEPGSIFKIVVTAAALTEEVVDEKSEIYCENGRFYYGGRTLRDHHGYGNLTVHNVLVKSSNIGSAKMALMLGEDKYYEYVRSFGFGERTGIDLPGEVVGIVHPPHRWDKLTITRMPMGHAIAVTPLQMTSAMASIANGGRLLKPQMVKDITSTDGDIIKDVQPHEIRRVVPKPVAGLVSNALAGVTGVGGTAKLANVPGFTVAGKTGTAQKVDPKGGYAAGKYVVSFLGYMPVEEPAFVCLVMVDDAKVSSGMNYGGLVAAPIFARISERAARYLNLVPTKRAEAVLPVALSNTDHSNNREVTR